MFPTPPLYAMYDVGRAMLMPLRLTAAMTEAVATNPANPFRDTFAAKAAAATADLFDVLTRDRAKPPFAIKPVTIGGCSVPIVEEVVLDTPFCRLVRFRRDVDSAIALGGPAQLEAASRAIQSQHHVFLAAPLSGHYATLLRGTVQEMARHSDVYITDWKNASDVPTSAGSFGLGDYIKLMRSFLQHIGPGAHAMAVCQPSVPLLAAVALMCEDKDPARPRSLVVMGGPIDTRINPQAPNRFAATHSLDWFRTNMVHTTPSGHQGFMRPVVPGFLMLNAFVGQNLPRHVKSHTDYWWNLVEGADAAVTKFREFEDDYKAVLDMDGKYYVETIDYVFINHLLPRGLLEVDGRRVQLGAIKDVAVMSVEGEKDDITGLGQTSAVHELLVKLPSAMKYAHVEPEAGHYGIFNGSRWRENIAPKVVAFQTKHDRTGPRRAGRS